MRADAVSDQRTYRIHFFQRGELYELYARQVREGGLPGFVEVEELVFGQRSEVVVDPGEERLKKEFEGVRRFHVPFHAVIRIDEVERPGAGRITAADTKGSVTPFPALYGHPGPGKDPARGGS